MDKTIIYLIAAFVFISVVVADTNFEFRYNPYTGKLDRNIKLNQSGNNITADYVFGNGSGLSGITADLQSHTLNGLNHTGNLSTNRTVKDTGTNYPLKLLDFIIDALWDRDTQVNNSLNIEITNRVNNDSKLDNKIDDVNQTYILWENTTGEIKPKPLQNINMRGLNINNTSNITTDRLNLADSNHFLKQEYEPINSISGSAMMLVDTGVEAEGEIVFSIIHAPNDNITDLKIIQCNQVGRNNSFSCSGNSQGMIRNDICTANPRFNNGTSCNMTAITDYLIQCEVWNKSCEYFADTAGRDGPLLWTQGDLEVWRTANIMEGIRVSQSADFIDTDLDVLNGSLHSQIPVNCNLGTDVGVERNLVDERFLGNLGVFDNLQNDPGNWHANSDARCDSDECANANGVGQVGNLIMQVNFSTLNFNQTGVSFVYSTTNMIAASSFSVTINNNSGSGDVTILTDTTDNVLKSTQFIQLDGNFTNITKVSLNFICNVIKSDRECFVDTVVVNGTHMINSTFSEPRIASENCFDTGERGSDGRCEFGSYWEPCNRTLVFRGNVTETNIITETETVTGDLTVGGNIILGGLSIPNWFSIGNFTNFLINQSQVRGLIQELLDIRTSIIGNLTVAQDNIDTNITQQNSEKLNITTPFLGDVSSTFDSISVDSSSKFNVTLICFDSATICSVNETWNGSCLIRNTPTTIDKQGSAC